MTRQLPAERPLENKDRILAEVLDDAADHRPERRTWLLPVAAAASIAVIATGALTVPSLLSSDHPGPSGEQSGTPSAPATKPAGIAVQSIDRGRLSSDEATAFGKECAKWIGSKDVPGQNFGDAPLNWPGAGAKIDKIGHATKVVGRSAKHPIDWTVAVMSGGKTFVCAGQFPTVDSKGHVRRDYAASNLSTKYPDGFGGTGGALSVISNHSSATMGTDRWVIAPPTAAQVLRRIVLNGKPGPWFGSAVVDGLGYIRTPRSRPLVPGDKIRIETKLVDAGGQQVGKLLTEPQKVVKADGFVGIESDVP